MHTGGSPHPFRAMRLSASCSPDRVGCSLLSGAVGLEMVERKSETAGTPTCAWRCHSGHGSNPGIQPRKNQTITLIVLLDSDIQSTMSHYLGMAYYIGCNGVSVLLRTPVRHRSSRNAMMLNHVANVHLSIWAPPGDEGLSGGQM